MGTKEEGTSETLTCLLNVCLAPLLEGNNWVTCGKEADEENMHHPLCQAVVSV